MTKAGAKGRNHQVCAWDATICEVDIEPAIRKTATRDIPIDSSYEITCAEERTAP